MTETEHEMTVPTPEGSKKNRAFIILALLVIVCSWSGGRWYLKSKTHITTDNAFVETTIIPVSFKVSGTVARVPVKDNQYVKKGELLAEIDDSDYALQVAKADAGVGMALNENSAETQQVSGAVAMVRRSEANHSQAVVDLKRGEALYAREVIPREQLDRLKTAEKIALAQLQEAKEGLKQAEVIAGLGSSAGARAKIKQRQSQLEEAKRQHSYTRVYAPQDGYITRKSVEIGANVQAGQPLMALVPLADAWIVANYKEAQIARIRPGQKVEFTVDAYPGRTLSGTVDSIMAGTGAAFSLLPPENATGNYVKVVQRVPVKIIIDKNSDPDHLLRVGMSVVPTVLTGR
jgi:membrane fusion protein (multidrug efflux system)